MLFYGFKSFAEIKAAFKYWLKADSERADKIYNMVKLHKRLDWLKILDKIKLNSN